MVGITRSSVRPFGAAAVLALLAAAASAQTCSGALPAPEPATDGAPKFRLIAQQCPLPVQPQRERRTEQLALFERAVPGVAITLAGLPAAEPAPPPAGPAGDGLALDAAGRRIVTLAPALLAAARAYGLDPLLLHAIAHVESRHDAQAVSPAGARGLMQVMPATGQRFGVADGRALFDADTNLRAAARYLQVLQARYGGDLRLVLAAYNAGEGAVARAGGDVPRFPETQAYVRDVLAVHRRLAARFEVTAAGTLVARGS